MTSHSASAASDGPDRGRVRASGPDTVSFPLPGLGTIRISRPELAYVSGIVALSVLGSSSGRSDW